jgi:membrane protease YdiL (CAAX protease family)
MTYAPTAWDFALFTLLIVAIGVEFLLLPKIKAWIASGVDPNARSRYYAAFIAATWTFTLSVCAIWIVYRRSWSALYLGRPDLLRVGAALAIVTLYLFYMLRLRTRMVANTGKYPRYRELMESVSIFAARTPGEYRLFGIVALTAGICEEVLMRGFVMSLFASLLGIVVGALVNIILFALGHAYQGGKGILRTGAFGVIMTIFVLATGSLVPAIVLHFIQDIVAGNMLYHVFKDESIESAASQANVGSQCVSV